MLKNSTRYFQLTPDILMEYNYTKIDVADDLGGDKSYYISDLWDYEHSKPLASVINSKYNYSKNFLYKPNELNFVLPTNISESKFIKCVSEGKYTNTKIWDGGSIDITEEVIEGLDSRNSDIIMDNFRLHFTGKNYLGDYDGFILTATIYDKVKNKLGLFSHYIKKTDDVQLNQDPMLINQKLYTTYLDFKLPSINAILNKTDYEGESELKAALTFDNYDIMENTPLVFTIYGVRSTYNYNQYEVYNTEKLNSIFVPAQDGFQNLSVQIEEATDGDYFKIYPVVDDGSTTSFSDYIYNISDGRPETYIILHELSLTEYYTDYMDKPHTDVTHREHYIVNAAQVDDVLEVNEEELDRVMLYRPIILHSGKSVTFMIEDQMKIINTLDNTTILKKGTYTYGLKENENPKKYGKHINKIYLGEIPAQVNVYNKRPDDLDHVKITNASSNVKIENHQHSVIGFIECTNVGVTIEQIPREILDN